MGADRRRHLQAVVGALVLKILDCAKGVKADQAGALVVALKNKGLKELYEQCEKDVANCHPASDWQNCSIVSNIIKTYKVALQCNRRLDARQALSYFFSPEVRKQYKNLTYKSIGEACSDTVETSNSNFYFIKLQS